LTEGRALEHRSGVPWLALALAAFAALAYGPALNLPFIGDDYVFLDKTRDATFWNLWSLHNVDFGWYRPWSRELHFWVLQRTAGLHEIAYRAVGILLWITALSLYASIVRRLASGRVAAIATLGVASLALWGTPLLWISGSQDLWMLSFAMASTLLFIAGRDRWALLAFGLALLSKETVAVLPALLVAWLVLVERRRPLDALGRTGSFWVLMLAWLAAHPTLHARLLSSASASAEVAHRPPVLGILAKTMLSTLNLDAIPRPQEVGLGFVLRIAISAAVLVAGVAFATRGRSLVESRVGSGQGKGALLRFAAVWALLGWFPLLLPSIGWHAYYGCLGALGAWLAIALWLQDRRRVAVAAMVGLAILRGAQANTLSHDWGNESYQRRAGSILSAIRDDLRRQYPVLPRHSRIYFTQIPNNIGLIAGRSPAMRVWYRDSTLQAGFYSYYQPRSAVAPKGEDLFFRFDSAVGMVEVKAGPEDVRRGLASDLNWESDHEDLAGLFLGSRDLARAAAEFEKISALPSRPDAAVYAAACREAAGDAARADSLIAAAASRTGLPIANVRERVARLRRSLRGR
jgi:hypothetical protein